MGDASDSRVKASSRQEDDVFDRLSHTYTVCLLVIFVLLNVVITYVGLPKGPIDCFTPQEFTDNWNKYVERYCWVSNTYFVPFESQLPAFGEVSDSPRAMVRQVTYYQWVPILLVFMAIPLHIPAAVWRLVLSMSGYGIVGVVKVTTQAENVDPVKRASAVEYIVSQLSRNMKLHRNFEGQAQAGNGYGKYLFIWYLITKLMYIAVSIASLVTLTTMMGDGYSGYGWRVVRAYILGEESPALTLFPKVTYCDYTIRSIGGNMQNYTTQCALPINLFNEKIFLTIWWWYVILCCLSVIGLLLFLLRMLWCDSNYLLVMRDLHLQGAANRKSREDQELVHRFTDEFLKQDGAFCLRMIARNVPDLITAEIITGLYLQWRSDVDERLVARTPRAPRVFNEYTTPSVRGFS